MLGSGGFKIARLFDIPILIHWSWFLIFGLVAFTFTGFFKDESPEITVFLAVIAAVGFFLSVLLHELSHSLVARRCGLAIKSITLMVFGGVAATEDNIYDKGPVAEFKIALAGLLCSFALGAAFLALASFVSFSPARTILLLLGTMNIILGVFNFLPGFPMDGGRVLRAILWWKSKNLLTATKTASQIGKWVAYGLPVAAFFWGGLFSALWLGLISWLIIIPAAQAEYDAIRLRIMTARDIMMRFRLPYEISVFRAALDVVSPDARVIYSSPQDNLEDVFSRARAEGATIVLVCDNKRVIGRLDFASSLK